PSLIPPEVLGTDIDNFAASAARPNAADIVKRNPIQVVSTSEVVAQDISDHAALNRNTSDGRLSGPLGEPILIKLLPTGAASDSPFDMQSGPLGTHLTSRVASLARTALSDEFLSGGTWATLFNASARAQPR